MPTKNLTDKLVFKIKADFLRALSHPVRLEIIEYLRHSEASVGKISHDLHVEQSVISKHLAALREAGIVSSQKEGSTVHYSIRDRDIFELLRSISMILRKKLAESHAVLDRLARP